MSGGRSVYVDDDLALYVPRPAEHAEPDVVGTLRDVRSDIVWQDNYANKYPNQFHRTKSGLGTIMSEACVLIDPVI